MQTQHGRLSIDHPEYRYPASKNPYWSKLHDLQGIVFSDNQTETHRGSWRSLFAAADPRAPLHVELGCNAGHVIVEWAQRDPATRYIGLDWKFKIIHRAAEKAQKRGLKNLIFFRSHAERLPYMFGPGEIDALYLFFPDPWPKKAQRKNRYVNPERLRMIAPLIKPDGLFHIKTDHDGYFEQIVESIEAAKDLWKVKELTYDLHAGHPSPEKLTMPEVTLFERLFIRDGIKIKSVKLTPSAL